MGNRFGSRNGLERTAVLIPTLEEAQGIGPTIQEILREMRHAEIVVVDSNSKDRTPQIAASLGVEVVSQQRRGKGLAVAEGLRHVKNDIAWVTIVDGDYTYPAVYISKMIKILRERPSVGMIGGMPYRAYMERYTFWKRVRWVHLSPYVIFHRILVTLHRILNGVSMQAPLTGQRVIRNHCIRDFQPKSKGFDIEVEINSYIRKKGYKILEIPVECRYRLGSAKFHRVKHLLVILRRMIIECIS